MPVPGLMSYDEWYAKAKPAAQAKGHPTDDATMQRAYQDYVWHAENPGGSSAVGKGGTGTVEQQQTGKMKGGSFADDSADAGNYNTGDPYLDELRSGRVANEEDWRRTDNATLKTWERFYIGGGKFRNQFGDIVSKPTDRGPNTPQGVNGLGQPMGGGGGTGFGGGMGGGGGAQPAAPGTTYQPTPWSPLQDMLMNQGGYLSQYDSQRGNNSPGIQGGVMGGSNAGSIWYQRTPSGGANLSVGTGVMGGRPGITPAPRSLTPAPGLQPGTTPPGLGTTPVFNAGFAPTTPRPGQNPLVTAMTPVQGQRTPSPLTDMLQPYQVRNKRPGSWF